MIKELDLLKSLAVHQAEKYGRKQVTKGYRSLSACMFA